MKRKNPGTTTTVRKKFLKKEKNKQRKTSNLFIKSLQFFLGLEVNGRIRTYDS